MSDRIGDWMRTYTGKRFWPLDPSPDEIHIEDIAHALSMLCRYGGHCKRFYSVAQHCVLVANSLPYELKLAGLLHDASEAYIVDVPRPLKRHLLNYCVIEERIMQAVSVRFDLPDTMPAEVKRVDEAILNDESAALMDVKPGEWQLSEPPLGISIVPWSPETAEKVFLRVFESVTE